MAQTSRIKIGEGIALNIMPTEKFKTGFLSVSFIGGLSSRLCSARALIMFILKRTSTNYPTAISLQRQLQELYGAKLTPNIRKKGDCQAAGLSLEFLGEKLATEKGQLRSAVSFLSELLLRPLIKDDGFDPTVFEQEKRNLTDHIEAKANDKVSYAVMRCYELMCEGEPFAEYEYGDADLVKGLDAKALYAAYREMIETAPIEINFVGSCDEAALAAELAGSFQNVRRKPLPIPESRTDKQVLDVRSITEPMQVKQAKLSLGFRTGITASNELYPALVLMNAIYGAAPTSKLFLNVRERLSLCYYCSSRIEKTKGLMLVSSGIENKNREQAQTEILHQLQEMKNGNFTDEDIHEAVIIMKNLFKSASDSAAAIEDWQLAGVISNAPETHEQLSAKLDKVSREQIITAANSIKLDTVYFLEGALA